MKIEFKSRTEDRGNGRPVRGGKRHHLCLEKHQRLLIFATFTKCQTPECDSEVGVVEGIDERIDGAVDPPEPRQKWHQNLADRFRLEERNGQVINEKRQPAGNEATDHHGERLCGFRFALRRRYADGHPFAVAQRTILADAGRAWFRYRCLAVTEMHILRRDAQLLLLLGAHACRVFTGHWRAANGWRWLWQINQFVQCVMRIVLFKWLLRIIIPNAVVGCGACHRFASWTLRTFILRCQVVTVNVLDVGFLRCLCVPDYRKKKEKDYNLMRHSFQMEFQMTQSTSVLAMLLWRDVSTQQMRE